MRGTRTARVRLFCELQKHHSRADQANGEPLPQGESGFEKHYGRNLQQEEASPEAECVDDIRIAITQGECEEDGAEEADDIAGNEPSKGRRGGTLIYDLETEICARLREYEPKNENPRPQILRSDYLATRGCCSGIDSSFLERINWKNSMPSRNRRCMT